MANNETPRSEEQMRFPVGPFTAPAQIGKEELQQAIQTIASLPRQLRNAVESLNESKLDTPYRPGGWTVRQVVHHLPDSHMNAYVRFRLALTEDNPTIKPYEEARWAELSDAKNESPSISLHLLDALHQRWVSLLNDLPESSWRRTYQHPEMGKQTLDRVALMYAWHSRHHLAHITELSKRSGW